MAFEPFMQYYFDFFPDFYNDVVVLSNKVGKNLFRKLKTNRSRTDFDSWISEMHIGLYFDKLCQIKNDAPIDGKTPDWTLTLNGQTILAEVLRINVDDEEMRQIHAVQEEIMIYNQQNPDKPQRFRGTPAKTLNSAYLYNHQSKMTRKEKRYAPIVQKYQIPLIICICPITDSYLNCLDVFDFLIASNKKGFFYTDPDFGKNVTGVFLYGFFGECVYFDNENAGVKLNQDNQAFFKSIGYKKPNW